MKREKLWNKNDGKEKNLLLFERKTTRIVWRIVNVGIVFGCSERMAGMS